MITRIEATRYRCLELLQAASPAYGVLCRGQRCRQDDVPRYPRAARGLPSSPGSPAGLHDQVTRPPARSSTLNELVFGGRGNDFILAIETELPETVITALLPSQSGPVQNNEQRSWLRFVRYEIRFEIFNDRQLVIGNEYLFLFSARSQPERGGARLFGETGRHRDWRFIVERNREGEAHFRAEAHRTGKARPAHVDGQMLALPKVQFESSADFPAARWLYDFLTRQCVFYLTGYRFAPVRQSPGMSTDLMLNAANLPWLVLELHDEADKFAAWVEHVKTALPQVTAIRAIEREEDHHAYLAVSYKGGYEVTSSGLRGHVADPGADRLALSSAETSHDHQRGAGEWNSTRKPYEPSSIRFSPSYAITGC